MSTELESRLGGRQTSRVVTASAAEPARRPLPIPRTSASTPYAEGDAPFFFGRERERRAASRRTSLASRLTLLYGASGVGKSSLLRAGVAHDFRAAAPGGLARRRLPESVLVVCCGWRDEPLPALADAIEAAVSEQLGELAPSPPHRPAGRSSRRMDPTPRRARCARDWRRRASAQRAADHSRPVRGVLPVPRPTRTATERSPWSSRARSTARDLRANFLVSIREDALHPARPLRGTDPQPLRLELPASSTSTRRPPVEAIEGPVERYDELPSRR